MEIKIEVLKTANISPCHMVQLEKWSYPTGENTPAYEMWTIRDRMYSPMTGKTVDINNTKFYFEDQAYKKFDKYVDGYTNKSIAPLENRTITSFNKDDGHLKLFIKNNRSYEIYNIIPISRASDIINPTPEDVTFNVKIGDDIFIGKCYIDENDSGWRRRYNTIDLKLKDSSMDDIDLYPGIIRCSHYPFFTINYGIPENNLFKDIKMECQNAIDRYMKNCKHKSFNPSMVHITNRSNNGEVDFYFTINNSIYENFTGHYYDDDKIIVYDSKSKNINVNVECRNAILGYSNGYFSDHYNVDDRELRDAIIYACKYYVE